jgi:hypothetical protein
MQLSIEEVGPETLAPYQKNARTHDAKQVRQIVQSIRQFGFTNPILVDETGEVIAGHGRLLAARELALEYVPVIRLRHLDDAGKRALRLADNKIALGAGWDLQILAAELEDLSSIEIDFDLEVTGFEVSEIDLIIEQSHDERPEAPETAEEPDMEARAISRRGDLWVLGRHRILCGDARNAEDYGRLMGDGIADVGFTDPPYNVPISGHVCGNGDVQHREFLAASGEMNETEFTAFLLTAFKQAAQHSRAGAVWFCCIDWRHLGEMRSAGLAAFGRCLNLCVWAKTNGGMGSLYRSQHELVFVFCNGTAPHRNNVELGRHGRNRTNVWSYPGVNTFRPGRMEELRAHPTAKPVAMVKDALLDVSRRGDIVLDPFLGAGATLMAAEASGRIVRGLEIDPLYVDVVLRRWRAETAIEPTRERDGRTLCELEAGE